jgi:hypothetical protein
MVLLHRKDKTMTRLESFIHDVLVMLFIASMGALFVLCAHELVVGLMP